MDFREGPQEIHIHRLDDFGLLQTASGKHLLVRTDEGPHRVVTLDDIGEAFYGYRKPLHGIDPRYLEGGEG